MSIVDGFSYQISNGKTGTVVDMSDDGWTVHGWESYGLENQRWTAEVLGESLYTLKNVASGKYLGLNGSPADGTQVIVVDQPFHWKIFSDPDDITYFRVYVPDTNQNLDLADHGNPDNGTLVTLWSDWEGDNQKWRFVECE